MGRSRTTCGEHCEDLDSCPELALEPVVAPPVLPGDGDGIVKPMKRDAVITNAI